MALAVAVCAVGAKLGSADEDRRNVWSPPSHLNAPIDLRVRVAWGGGAARPWDAEIAISAGALSQPTRLSMEADAPGATALEDENRRLRLWQRRPSSYDGADFSLLAPRNAVLTVRLVPRDGAGGEIRREIPLPELLHGVQNVALDERGNHLLIRRAPGDTLRVRLSRDALVFAPGERFQVEAVPHLTGFPPRQPLIGAAQLLPAEGGPAVWSQKQELTVGDDGSIPSTGPMTIPLPNKEGVYNLVLQYQPKASPPGQPLERRVQLVVIEDQPPPAPAPNGESPPWRPVMEIDPANPKWWERLTRWPQLAKWLPGFDDQELASGSLATQRRGERRFVVLEPGGWRAFPLPLGWSSGPHLLEVAYPTDAPQALGISVLEPNPAGEILPLGLDSGVVVAPPAPFAQTTPGDDGGEGVHHLVFWPRTDAPVLLLTNQRSDKPALVGRIRVLRGPERLPPATPAGFQPTESAGSARGALKHISEQRDASDRLLPILSLPFGEQAIANRPLSPFPSSPQAEAELIAPRPEPFPAGQRLLATWFDRPLFPENFSAPEALDEGTNRSLDDWTTFYLGAVRMIEYLKSRGYNAAAIPVWCEGSTLYPSRLLEPTPKYDTGVLFISGQDPVRKDVLEMLLRLGDREGIRLIPTLQFTTPLPALEQLLRGDAAQREGLEWINWRGRTWLQERGAPRGMAPYYNPLDDRVQAAIIEVVQELVDRYGRHPSFGGVALQLGPNSYAQLPGQYWGYDDRTVAQFADAMGVTVPGEGEGRFAQRDQWLDGDGRAAWLEWRARRMADLYRTLGRAVAQAGPQARLYLAGVALSRCEPVEAMMRPALPRRARFEEAMLHLGLDPQLWKDQPNIVLPRPRRSAPLAELPHRSVSIEIDTSADTTQFFAAAGLPAGLLYHEVRPQRLEAFDRVSPFGPEKTYTWLAPHLALHGAENRRRFARLLARSDVRVLFEGGWMLPLGQEREVQSLLDVYRRLPDAPFEDVTPTMGAAAQPVVVRQRSHDGGTWVYLVNDSPWPASVELELKAPPDCTAAPLTGPAATPLVRRGGSAWWKISLAPYDAAGAVFSSPEATVVDYLATFPPQVIDELRQRIRDIGARQYQLRDPQAHRYEALTNPGFEQPSSGEQIPGWEHGGPWGGVRVDFSPARDGGASLRLNSPSQETPTWIRSEPIPPPPSGKLTFSVWVRTADPAQQPKLSLSAQWRRHGTMEYRPMFFGRNTQLPLAAEWRECVFHVPLPADEIDQLRVGLDLYGPGEVWIDDVRLYDAWFEPLEKDELRKIASGADYDLSQGRIADCLRFLDGYWPQFLEHYVQPPPSRVLETPPAAPTAPTDKPVLDRLRGWRLRRLWPF